MNRPGNPAVQLALYADYPTNRTLYPRLHEALRASAVPLLAVWGQNDEIFGPAGAHAFSQDLPDARIELLDGRHFLPESHLDQVAATTLEFSMRPPANRVSSPPPELTDDRCSCRRVHRMNDDAGTWFLSGAERGNQATDVHAGGESSSWSEGNLVRPLIHGAVYFKRLHEELSALRSGDRVWFTDWRGDADEKLLPDGPTVGDLLAGLARDGVEVRGLIWRSHGERISSPISGRSNELLGRQINDAGGEVLLDQRVRVFGSHHQKFFVIRRRDDPSLDVAFVGGLDLCHSRRDDADHHGDPQALAMDERYGKQPPWHDAALELRGPVVADLLDVFAERWNDPHPLDKRTPYRMLLQRLARMPRHPKPLPDATPPPPVAGPHAVQLLRTYGVKKPPFPFAPQGERSVARAYTKAFAQAKSLHLHRRPVFVVEGGGGGHSGCPAGQSRTEGDRGRTPVP